MTAPLRVLLVEDNPGDAELIRQAFEEGRAVVDVQVATDGDQALAYLQRRPPHADAPRPDLVLLDLGLPERSGLSVLAEMKQHDALRTIPVIVLSSSTARPELVQSYELGGSCYIEKPVGLEALGSVVRSIRDFWLTAAKLP